MRTAMIESAIRIPEPSIERLTEAGVPVFCCILCGKLIDSVIMMNRTGTVTERELCRRVGFRRRTMRVVMK